MNLKDLQPGDRIRLHDGVTRTVTDTEQVIVVYFAGPHGTQIGYHSDDLIDAALATEWTKLPSHPAGE